MNYYSDRVAENELLYENSEESIKEIKEKYKENVEKVADRLIEEGVVIDYNPFSNLLLCHDRLLNKMKF